MRAVMGPLPSATSSWTMRTTSSCGAWPTGTLPDATFLSLLPALVPAYPAVSVGMRRARRSCYFSKSIWLFRSGVKNTKTGKKTGVKTGAAGDPATPDQRTQLLNVCILCAATAVTPTPCCASCPRPLSATAGRCVRTPRAWSAGRSASRRPQRSWT